MKLHARLIAVSLFTWLGLHGAAWSHHVWLEQDANGATLYFGEFGENLRETTPGLLDKFVAPTAQRISASAVQALNVTKTAKGFVLSGGAAKGESLVAEDLRYPISERKDGDQLVRSIYVPAARLVNTFDKQKPQLALDLVPTGIKGKDGVELQVFYKGQPLPRAKVEVVTPLGWGKELRGDDQGRILLSLPWKGSYVLEVKHADNSGGERGAEKYDRASYVTSLTLTQVQGLPALPSAPAAAPNKLN
ncbi:DUF4198 domain-containing protein [Polaromonas sp. SM01]|uniref:DUF4198 domain-containing protein n=1 Tax=Polaromonas sp. SM01 TaxID=3085630 RepID=UPI002982ACAA|nr:DUF4198 domain-containing protein [Polaromonas sp. SM01]MDW5441943.1 DUF4198 domain-containing protein [Polaromonas sp. SM01]